MVLTSGSFAMEIREPGQGRNTAALSGSFHVTRGRLEGVNCEGNVYCEDSKRDARFFIINFCLARWGGQPLLGYRRHESRHSGGSGFCGCIYDLRG